MTAAGGQHLPGWALGLIVALFAAGLVTWVATGSFALFLAVTIVGMVPIGFLILIEAMWRARKSTGR